MASNKQIKITLVKSLIGRLPGHKATVASLGLKRMHQTVHIADTPSNRGQLQKVGYLLKVEEGQYAA